jgi:hypothetical protein
LLEKENEKEDKPKSYSVKIVEGIALADTASSSSISTISSSVKQSFDTLRGTFDTNQKFIADYLHIEQNLEYLPEIAENMEKAVKLAEKQRDEAIKEARKDRNRFYVGVLIGVVGIVVGAIIGTIALLR